MGLTEKFAFVNIEYRFEIDFINPSISSKNLEMGKLNGSR